MHHNLKCALIGLALTGLIESVQAEQEVVLERGPDHRVVQVIQENTADDGSLVMVTNSVVELGNSMHYWENNAWQESSPVLDIVDGRVVGAMTPHILGIEANLNVQGAVTFVAGDNKLFTSTPLFLALRSQKTGESVLVAQIQDCQAEILGEDQVIFRSAMAGLNCSLLYMNRIDGIEQNLVLHEPIDLAAFQFSDDDQVQLELWTEFYDSPQAVTKTVSADGQADVYLNFGATRIGTGKAFLLEGDNRDVPVAKRFGQVEGIPGRTFMVEMVKFESVKPLMQTLKEARAGGVNAKIKGMAKNHTRNNRELFAQLSHQVPRESLVASNVKRADGPLEQGLVIDYQTVSSGTSLPTVFRSDMTYYVKDAVTYVADTLTTFEAGTVLKLTNSASITINGTVDWQGQAFRPITLTSVNDQSVGQKLNTVVSANTFPKQRFAQTALKVNAGTSGQGLVLRHLRVSNAQVGIEIQGGTRHLLAHCQFVNLDQGIKLGGGAEVVLRNALFDNVLVGLGGVGCTVRAEHITLHTLFDPSSTPVNQLIPCQFRGDLTSCYLTNSILAGLGNNETFEGTAPGVLKYGNYSGGTPWTLSQESTLFQVVGSGRSYLAASSPARNIGVTAGLASFDEIQKLTTSSPLTMTGTLSGTYNPRLIREADDATQSTLDAGYHYYPIDYAISAGNLSTTLTLNAGMMVATYGTVGITLLDGGKYISGGTPLKPNRLFRSNAVQEQPTGAAWSGNVSGIKMMQHTALTTGVRPEVVLTSTEVSSLGTANVSEEAMVDCGANSTSVRAVDSSLFGIYQGLFNYNSSQANEILLTNCVLVRPVIYVAQGYSGSWYSSRVNLRNCLVLGGALTFNLNFTTTAQPIQFEVQDNVFASVALTSSSSAGFVPNNAYNAYSGTTPFSGGATGNRTLAALDFVAGPLGSYYYPDQGANLASLRDVGSAVDASKTPLTHYTTRLNQERELFTVLDIGFHYAALDLNGQLIDSDSNGVADYKASPPSLTVGSTVTYTESTAAIIATSATATISDGSANCQNGFLVVDTIYAPSTMTVTEQLSVQNQGTGAGQVGVSGGVVSYGNTAIATVSGGLGSPLQIVFNLQSTVASAQAVLRQILYKDTSTSLNAVSRTLRFYFSDGHGGYASASKSLTILNVNSAPAFSAIANQIAVPDQTVLVPFTLTDDNPSLVTLTAASGDTAVIPNAAANLSIIQNSSGRFVSIKPSTGTRSAGVTITLTASDPGATPSSVTASFSVKVGIPPSLVLSPGDSVYYPGMAPTPIDSGVTFQLQSGATLNGGAALIEAATGDSVALLTGGSVILGANNALTVGGVGIGTLDASQPSSIVKVSLNSFATLANVQTILRNVVYGGSRVAKTDNSPRSIKFSVDDNLGLRGTAPKNIRLFEERPLLKVDAGLDSSISLAQLNAGYTFPTSFGAGVTAPVSGRIRCRWTVIDPIKPGQIHLQVLISPAEQMITVSANTKVQVPLFLNAGTPVLSASTRLRLRLEVSDGIATVIDEVNVGIYVPGDAPILPEVAIRPLGELLPSQLGYFLQAEILKNPSQTVATAWQLNAPNGSLMPVLVGSAVDWQWNGTAYTSTKTKPQLGFVANGSYSVTMTVTASGLPVGSNTASDTHTFAVCSQIKQPVDIVFMGDTSGSFFPQTFMDVRSAVRMFSQNLEKGIQQISFIEYDEQAYLKTGLTDNLEIIAAAAPVTIIPGKQNQIFGFPEAAAELFGPAANPTARKIIIMFSDGDAAFAPDQTLLARQLRAAGVRIVCIAPVITDPTQLIYYGDLHNFASSSSDLHMGSFNQWIRILGEVLDTVCAPANTPPAIELPTQFTVMEQEPLVLAPTIYDDSFSSGLTVKDLSAVWTQTAPASPLGEWSTQAGVPVTVRYATAGDYQIRVTVTDTSGGIASQDCTVHVVPKVTGCEEITTVEFRVGYQFWVDGDSVSSVGPGVGADEAGAGASSGTGGARSSPWHVMVDGYSPWRIYGGGTPESISADPASCYTVYRAATRLCPSTVYSGAWVVAHPPVDHCISVGGGAVTVCSSPVGVDWWYRFLRQFQVVGGGSGADKINQPLVGPGSFEPPDPQTPTPPRFHFIRAILRTTETTRHSDGTVTSVTHEGLPSGPDVSSSQIVLPSDCSSWISWLTDAQNPAMTSCQSCQLWRSIGGLRATGYDEIQRVFNILPETIGVQPGNSMAVMVESDFLKTYTTPRPGADWRLDVGPDLTVPLQVGAFETTLRADVVHRNSPRIPSQLNWSLLSQPSGGVVRYRPSTGAAWQPWPVGGVLRDVTLACADLLDIHLEGPAGAPPSGNFRFKAGIDGGPRPDLNTLPSDFECTLTQLDVVGMSDEITISVGGLNLNAGKDLIVDIPSLDAEGNQQVAVQLSGQATLGTTQLSPTTWSFLEVPAAAIGLISPTLSYPSSLTTPVTLRAPGRYILALAASASGLQLGQDTLVIEVNEGPRLVKDNAQPTQHTIWFINSEAAGPVYQKGNVFAVQAEDDGLPSNSTLSYRWSVTGAPNGNLQSAKINTPSVKTTSINFAELGDYTLKVEVSDGRQSVVGFRTFAVTEDPAALTAAYQFDGPTVNKVIDLTGPSGPWGKRGWRVLQIVSTQSRNLWRNGTGETLGVNDAGVSQVYADTGIHYTSSLPTSPCGWLEQQFDVTVDTGDTAHTQKTCKLIIAIKPTEWSRESYEVSKHFRRTAVVGGGTYTLNLSDMFRTCPRTTTDPGGESIQYWELPSDLGATTITLTGGDQILSFTPTQVLSQPVTRVLTFLLAGAPGIGTLELTVLHLNTGLPPSVDLGSQMVEVGQRISPVVYSGVAGWSYNWNWVRISGPGTGLNTDVHFVTSAGVSASTQVSPIVYFDREGIYEVYAYIKGTASGCSQCQSPGDIDTSCCSRSLFRFAVVPPVSISHTEDLVDDDTAEAAPLYVGSQTPAIRAVITQLPLPGGVTPVIQKGNLTLQGQAAGPADADQADYKVYFYPIDKCHVLEPSADDPSQVAIDVTASAVVSDVVGTWYTPTFTGDGYINRKVVGYGSTPAQTVLAKIDLTKIPNGSYAVQICVRSSALPGQIGRSGKHPITINTDLRPRSLQFETVDFTLPVGGGKLSLGRYYDSVPGAKSVTEMGTGWLPRFLGQIGQVYEARVTLTEDDLDSTSESAPISYSVRQGGPQDVSLQLPGSYQWATFTFYDQGNNPVWRAPSGLNLRVWAPTPDLNVYRTLMHTPRPFGVVSLSQQARSSAQFDFSKYILGLPSGEEYHYTRGQGAVTTFMAWDDNPALRTVYWEAPKLTKIVYPDGIMIQKALSGSDDVFSVMPSGGGSASATVTIHRLNGKPIDIQVSVSPGGNGDTRPAVKYTYYQPTDRMDLAGNYAVSGDLRIGNLKEVWILRRLSSPANDSDYDVTRYYYQSSASPHLLAAVVNALGVKESSFSWTTDGQLQQSTDSRGIVSDLNLNGASQTQDLLHPFGNKTLEEYVATSAANKAAEAVKRSSHYDDAGHVTQDQVEAPAFSFGGVSFPARTTVLASRTFDSDDRLVAQGRTVVQGDGSTISLTSKVYYDENGVVSSAMAPDDSTTSLVRDESGRVTDTVNPLGQVAHVDYTDNKVGKTVDQAGVATKFNYIASGNLQGRLSSEEDALGNQTQYEYYTTTDSASGAVLGLTKKVTFLERNATGVLAPLRATTYTYNPDGTVKTDSSTRSTRKADGSTGVETVKREYRYDSAGRQTEVWDYPSDNSYTSFVDESKTADGLQALVQKTLRSYDQGGRLVAETDKYGSKTEYLYDDVGNLVQTIYPGGRDGLGNITEITISRTVYDINNKPIYSTTTQAPALGDAYPYLGETSAPGSGTIYDEFGRPAVQTKYANVSSKLTQVPAANGGLLAGIYRSTKGTTFSPSIIEQSTTDYDQLGRAIKVTYLGGSFVQTKFFAAQPASTDVNGDVVPRQAERTEAWVSGPSGPTKISEVERDSLGRTSISRNASLENHYSYDEGGHVSEVATKRLFQVAGMDTLVELARTSKAYDVLGRVTQELDVDGRVKNYKYNGLGDLVEVAQPNDPNNPSSLKVSSYAYDEVGNLISVKTAAAAPNETKFAYDNFGRRIARIWPSGQTEWWGYDLNTLTTTAGQQGIVTLANGYAPRRNLWKGLNGQLVAETSDMRARLLERRFASGPAYPSLSPQPTDLPSPAIIAFSYTPWGARRSMVDDSGTTTYYYGRVSWSGGGTPTLSFDTDRLVASVHVDSGTVVGPSQTLLSDYDLKGRLSINDLRWQFTLSPSSPAFGSVLGSADATRQAARYTYDDQSRLASVAQLSAPGSSTTVANYTYNADGLLQGVDYPGTANTPDPAGFGQRYDYTSLNTVAKVSVTQNAITREEFDYNTPTLPLTPAGLRQGVQERKTSATGTVTVRRTISYSYDTLEQLAKESRTVTGTLEPGNVSYTYGPTGNRLKRTVSNVSGGSPNLLTKVPTTPATGSFSYDANDRPGAPYTFDSAGDALRTDLNGDGTSDQTLDSVYDYAGRLVHYRNSSGTQVTLVYDGDGNRLRKQVRASSGATSRTFTRYIASPQNPTGYSQVLEEWNATAPDVGSATAYALTARYTHGLRLVKQDRLVAGATGTDYFAADGLGSVRFLIQKPASTWQLGDSYVYDSFGIQVASYDSAGALIAAGGGTANKYRFAGEQWDSDLGLYYLRARYYNPSDGRFISTDTFEGSQQDPLTLHKYLYAHGNPVNGVDPSGHETLVSMNFTMAIMGQVNSMYLMSSSKALGAAQRISGSSDFADLIYGLEVASIVQDKVSLALGAAGLTYATVKVAKFLSTQGYKFLGTSSVRTLEEFRAAASKAASYYEYAELRAAIKAAGLSGQGTGLEAHHLLHQVFAQRMGLDPLKIIAVPLTPANHRNVGRLSEIGAGENIFQRLKDKLTQMGTTVESASVEHIWKAHKSAYEEINHPEWAHAIYEAYFQGKGIAF